MIKFLLAWRQYVISGIHQFSNVILNLHQMHFDIVVDLHQCCYCQRRWQIYYKILLFHMNYSIISLKMNISFPYRMLSLSLKCIHSELLSKKGKIFDRDSSHHIPSPWATNCEVFFRNCSIYSVNSFEKCSVWAQIVETNPFTFSGQFIITDLVELLDFWIHLFIIFFYFYVLLQLMMIFDASCIFTVYEHQDEPNTLNAKQNDFQILSETHLYTID